MSRGRQRTEADKARDALLLANLRDAVIVTDLEGVVTYWNDEATRLFGWTAEERLGRLLVERIPSAARPAMAEQLRRIAAGQGWNGDYQDWRKDGSRVWIDARVTRMDDAVGQPIGILGLSHDISDRKRAEAERDQLFARLRIQIERLPFGYALFDADFRLLDWNPAAERIFGYSREEMLGAGPPFAQIVPPAAWPEIEAVLARNRAGDMTADRSGLNHTKDGRVIYCEWYNTPLFDDQGRFQGMFALAHDVTARRQAEASLRLLERAVQAATQGILIADVTHPENPAIIYASPAFLRLTGYSAEEIRGRNAFLLLGQDSGDATVGQKILASLREGKPLTAEMFTRRKDGSGFWDEVFLSPIADEHGQVTHFVGVHTDITARRGLEQQYLQAQKMEAVGQLAAGIAHDFNNLLTVINGYSEVLLKRLPPTDPSWKAASQIKMAGARSTALTRQLLAFSRQEVHNPAVLNLNQVLADMVPMLQRVLGEDVEFTAFLAPDLGLVKADPGQLEQVVMNLAVNARDAMPRGGKLSVGTRNCTVVPGDAHAWDAPPGAFIELAVSDTGSGMTREVQARIFEPFFTTKGKHKGTGLGLAVVHGIVRQNGGFIAVDTQPGRGTTFTIHLPRVFQPATPPEAEPTPASTPGHETILLVEDDEDVRELTQMVLEEAGYAVLVASGGEPALALARQHTAPIRLLVTDVVMAGMGGRLVADHLVALHPEAKVLYISGYTDDAIVRHGVEHERVQFLHKPFTPDALVSKVQAILDGTAGATAG